MRGDALDAWLRGEDALQAETSGSTGGQERHDAHEQRREAPGVEEPLWDEWPADEQPRRRRVLLLTAAAVPWLVVAVLAARLLAPPVAPVPPSPGDAPPAVPAGQVEAGQVEAGQVEQEQPRTRAPAAAGRDPDRDVRAGAIAAVAVRAALAASTEPGPGGVVRYPDVAAAEQVRWLGDIAAVTVAGFVLEGRDGTWERARPARWGIAMAEGDAGLRPLGPPWPLPPPDLEARDVAWAPARADVPAVVRAVAAAGYAGASVRRVERSDVTGELVRAHVTATAPGEAEPREHVVWLVDAGALRVLALPEHEPFPAPSAAEGQEP